MEINVLIVRRNEKAPHTCWPTQCLGDKGSPEDFQIRVLSYNNHYFWWRPSGARVFCDKVFIKDKGENDIKDQERKRRKKDKKDQQKKKNKTKN